jgi:hypothetical protein
MATVAVVRRIQRIGQLIAFIGSALGLAVCLFVFKGDLSRSSIFFLGPLWLGWLVFYLGKLLEKYPKQPDVGRQMRQP